MSIHIHTRKVSRSVGIIGRKKNTCAGMRHTLICLTCLSTSDLAVDINLLLVFESEPSKAEPSKAMVGHSRAPTYVFACHRSADVAVQSQSPREPSWAEKAMGPADLNEYGQVMSTIQENVYCLKCPWHGWNMNVKTFKSVVS